MLKYSNVHTLYSTEVFEPHVLAGENYDKTLGAS
jgi:hypothetical protein